MVITIGDLISKLQGFNPEEEVGVSFYDHTRGRWGHLFPLDIEELTLEELRAIG